MQCGSDYLWCQILRLIFEDEGAGAEVFKALAAIAMGTHPAVGVVSNWLHENASKLAALVSIVFAIWKWWHFRESVLHRRLVEYIQEGESRLGPSRDDVLMLIDRPDRRNNVRQPSFAPELAGLLMRHGWTAAADRVRPYRKMCGELKKADQRLVLRMQTAQKAIATLNNQRIALLTIEGALASAQAGRCKAAGQAAPFIEASLIAYNRALELQGDGPNRTVLEGKALQLMRRGKYELAAETLERLELLANDGNDPKATALLRSRILRFRALLLRATGNPGAHNTLQDALTLRARFAGTMAGWEEIDQAEFHYTSAYLMPINRVRQRAEQLDLACASYDRALSAMPKWRRPILAEKRRLWHVARNGKARVERARRNAMTPHDYEWLFQPPQPTRSSDDSQQPTGTVS